MTRATRNRQTSALLKTETDIKTNTKSTVAKRATKENSSKTRSSSKKISKQDENAVPFAKNSLVSSVKNVQTRAIVLGSKLHSAKTNNSSVRRSSILAMKSPVLRDRTNTNELNKVDISSQKSSALISSENKRTKNQKVEKVEQKNNKKSIKSQEKKKKFNDSPSNVEKDDAHENNPKETKDKHQNRKSPKEDKVSKINLRKNSAQHEQVTVTKESEMKFDDNNKVQESASNEKLKSQDSNNTQSRTLRRKNISAKDIENALNQNEEINDFKFNEAIDTKTKTSKINKNQKEIKSSINNGSKKIEDSVQKKDSKLSNAETECFESEKIQKDEKVIKKFFKNKGIEQKTKSTATTRKNPGRQVNNRKKAGINKKTQHDESSYSINIENKESTKPVEKKLRPRTIKNYCEVSKLLQNSSKEKPSNAENPITEKNQVGVPIYKTIRLSQESVKDKEEVYNFPDDSQEKDEKGKKRKKTIKKSAIKRVKKAIKRVVSQKVEKKTKSVSKLPRTVQFEDQIENQIENQIEDPVNLEQPVISNNLYNNIIPEHLQNAGESTIEEASTIKIVSDKKLEGSTRISLTSTPPVPKTITSELKLFGPKNVITSQPKPQYNNMINHSLIRQSMSPITKVADEFDAGSPWRPVDTFTRVQRIVQSTPQINRIPMREKKFPVKVINFNQNQNAKSISSEETIHISSIVNEKSSNKEETLHTQSVTKVKEASPRKFGTVISNLNSVNAETDKNVTNNKNLVHHNQQSPVKTISQTISSQLIVDQEEIPFNTKENIIPSPKKSPTKKYSTPSPFRFEKIQSSKKIASVKSPSKLLKSSSQKENEEPNVEAGPSSHTKSKSRILRQTTLNNFLNLDEMPESTRISTAHGIFDDVHTTPINGKRPKPLIEEANIENAFGFDDSDYSEFNPVTKNVSTPVIATEKDIKESVKGKVFLNARVKSAVPLKASQNIPKTTLLKSVLKKQEPVNKINEIVSEENDNMKVDEEDSVKANEENNNEPEKVKKAMLDAVSFSDTFDVLSENGEDVDVKIPDEIPLFVDLEPVHFTQPPRRSYNKRKRAVYFDTSQNNSESDEDDCDKPKSKKKKESKLSREEQKRMQEWVRNVNDTFNEIEHFDLVVEYKKR